MSLMETISKKTSFTVAVGTSLFLWAGLAAFFGILCDYFVMKERQFELFITIITVIGTMAPFAIFIQISLLGLIKPLCLKPLRPINKNIDGVDFIPGITVNQLHDTIAALKRFPTINGILGGSLITIIIIALVSTVLIQQYEFFWVMTQVIFGTLAIVIYTVATIFYTDAQVKPLRKKAYYIINEHKKRNDKKQRR
ncbi:MAG: hypothetical protein PF482_00425 [Desulfobacteraceae bacterium]|jgi:hypothetical protein|nr:hypothetical protein [Desulfobacteraceae bacterium]